MSDIVLYSEEKSIDESNGIVLSQFYNRLDAMDFTNLIIKFSVNFGLDFSPKEDNQYFLKVKDIFERCKALGWSKEEFSQRLEWFLDNHQWKDFTRAHFISKYERPKLYPYTWYLEQINKNPDSAKDIESWEVPINGQNIIMYRYADGTNIPGLNRAKPKNGFRLKSEDEVKKEYDQFKSSGFDPELVAIGNKLFKAHLRIRDLENEIIQLKKK